MGEALIADGRWHVRSADGKGDDLVCVQWLRRDGDRVKVLLCEDAYLPSGRILKAGSTKTIDVDAYVEFDDDDFDD